MEASFGINSAYVESMTLNAHSNEFVFVMQ